MWKLGTEIMRSSFVVLITLLVLVGLGALAYLLSGILLVDAFTVLAIHASVTTFARLGLVAVVEAFCLILLKVSIR